jgi:hypothetical protein
MQQMLVHHNETQKKRRNYQAFVSFVVIERGSGSICMHALYCVAIMAVRYRTTGALHTQTAIISRFRFTFKKHISFQKKK